ncbi:MAG: hemerythrin domain-containing protein [Dehalococcoidia bacterium]|nr:hemerythrin domain-containing protein [Dehalococcoidia bacterium]
MAHEDFFRQLRTEHSEVKSIIQQIMQSSDKEQKFMTLKRELMPHMKGEEAVFYPPLKQNPETRMDALEAIEEHHAAEMTLNELDSMPKNQDEWTAKLMVLKDMLEHHIEVEEGKIFDSARSVIPETQAEMLLKNYMQEKEKISSTLAR